MTAPDGVPGLNEDGIAKLYGEVMHGVPYNDHEDDVTRWCEVVESTVREVVASRWLVEQLAAVRAATLDEAVRAITAERPTMDDWAALLGRYWTGVADAADTVRALRTEGQ